MLKLKLMHIHMISLAKIIAVVNGMFGVILGFFILISKMLGVELQGDAGQLQSYGFWAIIILPVTYSLIGALSGVAFAFFVNTATKWVGPLQIDVAERG